MPPGSWVGGPSATVCGSRPDNQWGETSTISGNLFNCCDQSPLNSSTPVVPEILSTHQDFERTQDTQQDTCLIHVVHIFRNNCRVAQLFTNHCKPFYNFVVDVVPCPIQKSDLSCLELQVALAEVQ